METTITKSFVKKVKSHLKQNWHNSDWHKFNETKEVEAVSYAMKFAPPGSDDDDIIAEAYSYLESVYKD